jgi:uncharacterized membrane protein
VIWRSIFSHDAGATAGHAMREDDSRLAADGGILSACIASLVAVAFVLVKAGEADGVKRGLLTAVAVVGVLVAWAVVHTIFTLKYGHAYYDDQGGIDFGNDKDDPSYRDFAYMAFTIGMTYQVSDTSLTSRRMRTMALQHALLSFLFGTAIIAMTINGVAGLLGH